MATTNLPDPKPDYRVLGASTDEGGQPLYYSVQAGDNIFDVPASAIQANYRTVSGFGEQGPESYQEMYASAKSVDDYLKKQSEMSAARQKAIKDVESLDIFQGVNRESGGALAALYGSINSGQASVFPGSGALDAGGRVFGLTPTGTPGIYAVRLPQGTAGSYLVPVAVDEKTGTPALPKQFLTDYIQYRGGQKGGWIQNTIQDIGPIGQLALAAATSGMSLPAQAAAMTAYNMAGGKDFGDALKSGVLSAGLSQGIGALSGSPSASVGDMAASDAIYAGASTPAWEASLANVLPATGAMASPVAESALSSTTLGPLEGGGIADVAANDVAAQQAAAASMPGAGTGAAEAGGIADLLGATDPADYANLGSGAGGDYGIETPSPVNLGSTNPADYENLGSGAGGDYGIETPSPVNLGSTNPADYENLGSGAGGDYGIETPAAGTDWTNPDNWDKAGLGDPGMGGAASGLGLGTLISGAKKLLGSDTGVGGLTGGGALLGAAGLYKLIDMMKEDNKRFGTPGRQDYTGGALSKFKYDPSAFTATRADPNKFRPGAGIQTLATGGKTQKPTLTSKAKLAALDPYLRAVAEMNNAAYNARMPTAMQMPAGSISQMGQYAAGGVSHLGDYSDGGRLLRGPGDGVSDSIPATIGGKQPARLADGEFVVPARIVSELGNGSTDAGARKLYAMMDRIQRARGNTTGKGKVAKNTNADKYLPA